ncbi:MAG: type II secretion system protein GspJ [Myxococcota bacterium]
MTHAGGRRGFTLIEVMAVIFLTAIVFGVALDFYIDLSDQSHHASEATRELRRATSLLDRVAGDFERALIARKPEDMDPLAHPWVFLGESRRATDGADRVKFVTRLPQHAGAALPVADIAMVSYALEVEPDGEDYRLVRWSDPHLPEGLDREFAPSDDPRSQVMAEGLIDFAVRFLDEAGEWVAEWDSSQLLDSSELPLAVEIEVALAPLEVDDDELFDPAAVPRYSRQVLLPVRPLDLVTLLDPVAYAALGEGESEGSDGECRLFVRDCVDLSQGLGGAGSGGSEGLDELVPLDREQREAVRGLDLNTLANLCWDDVKDQYPTIPVTNPECR